MPRHAKSAPAAFTKTTASKIDQRIVEQLKKPLTPNERDNQDHGNNYIFETMVADNPEKKVMKIGRTTGSEYVRLATISKGCQHALIEKQDDLEHMPIRLHGRAEILMHKELEDFRYSFSCRCKKVKAHREYFDIGKDVALDVVQRWRRFCDSEPYGRDGKLKPFWEQRLRHMKCFGKPEDDADHWSLAKRWDKFTTPSPRELVLFDVFTTLEKIWRRKWETIALVQSIFILFLTSPSSYTLVWCFGIWFGVAMELDDSELPMLPGILMKAWNASRKQATAKSQKGAVDRSKNATECLESPDPEEEPEEEDVPGTEIDGSNPSGEDEDMDMDMDDSSVIDKEEPKEKEVPRSVITDSGDSEGNDEEEGEEGEEDEEDGDGAGEGLPAFARKEPKEKEVIAIPDSDEDEDEDLRVLDKEPKKKEVSYVVISDSDASGED
jgi:hypothetical protein